jgi:hypothetical protein
MPSDFYRENAIYSVIRLNVKYYQTVLNFLRSTKTHFDSNLDVHREYLKDIEYIRPDRLVENLRDNKIDYVMAGSLRTNPEVANGRIVGTIRKQLIFMDLRYPGFLELVHTIGKEESTYLYHLNYDYFNDDQ